MLKTEVTEPSAQPPLTFLPCAPAAIPTSKRSRLHSYANHISDTAAMRGSRMRPVVKVEDGVGTRGGRLPGTPIPALARGY